MITLDLPYPPSVNRYYRSPRSGPLAGRTLISKEGRDYRKAVAKSVLLHPDRRAPAGRLAVSIALHVPDRRRRDIDNPVKPLLDALQHAGVIDDDEFIDLLTVQRAALKKGGAVRVYIKALEGAINAN